jgi:hypothetical protein
MRIALGCNGSCRHNSFTKINLNPTAWMGRNASKAISPRARKPNVQYAGSVCVFCVPNSDLLRANSIARAVRQNLPHFGKVVFNLATHSAVIDPRQSEIDFS